MQLQRLGVPTLRNPFWGRLVLAAAIAVVLLLYVTIRSSGTTSTAEVFGSRGHVQLVQPNASIENRLAGSVHQNRWREHAGDLHGTPGEIPKVLYVSVADKAKMPAVSQSSLNSCKKLNPAYKVEVMGDAERNETFAKHAPSLLPVYSRLKPTERNDFWSYLVSRCLALHPHVLCHEQLFTENVCIVFPALFMGDPSACCVCADAISVWRMVYRS